MSNANLIKKTETLLDYYVYVVIDCAKKEILHVGKGRSRKHFSDAEKLSSARRMSEAERVLSILGNPKKSRLINEIASGARVVEKQIVRRGLSSKDARLLEETFCDVLNFENVGCGNMM